jgi:Ser/Thr protein kinase RdoA (MazF antagonist)
VPRVIASKRGNDREWIAAADGKRHMVRVLSWLPGTPLSQSKPLGIGALRSAAAFQAKLARGLQGFFHPHARHFVAWDIQRGLLFEPGIQAWVADDAKALCADSMRASSEMSCRACLPCARRSCTATATPTTCCARNPAATRSSASSISATWCTRRWCRTSPSTLASFARHGEMSLENAVAQVEAWNAVLPLADEELAVLHDLTLLRIATALCMYDFRIHATEKPPAWLTRSGPTSCAR